MRYKASCWVALLMLGMLGLSAKQSEAAVFIIAEGPCVGTPLFTDDLFIDPNAVIPGGENAVFGASGEITPSNGLPGSNPTFTGFARCLTRVKNTFFFNIRAFTGIRVVNSSDVDPTLLDMSEAYFEEFEALREVGIFTTTGTIDVPAAIGDLNESVIEIREALASIRAEVASGQLNTRIKAVKKAVDDAKDSLKEALDEDQGAIKGLQRRNRDKFLREALEALDEKQKAQRLLWPLLNFPL